MQHAVNTACAPWALSELTAGGFAKDLLVPLEYSINTMEGVRKVRSVDDFAKIFSVHVKYSR